MVPICLDTSAHQLVLWWCDFLRRMRTIRLSRTTSGGRAARGPGLAEDGAGRPRRPCGARRRAREGLPDSARRTRGPPGRPPAAGAGGQCVADGGCTIAARPRAVERPFVADVAGFRDATTKTRASFKLKCSRCGLDRDSAEMTGLVGRRSTTGLLLRREPEFAVEPPPCRGDCGPCDRLPAILSTVYEAWRKVADAPGSAARRPARPAAGSSGSPSARPARL
jgi:hypothetical protein